MNQLSLRSRRPPRGAGQSQHCRLARRSWARLASDIKKTLIAATVIVMTSVGAASAQVASPFIKRDPNYTVPKTPWGDPDLQGKWPSTDMVGTPMQRDAKLGTRNVLTAS